jgi:hypothetical protein
MASRSSLTVARQRRFRTGFPESSGLFDYPGRVQRAGDGVAAGFGRSVSRSGWSDSAGRRDARRRPASGSPCPVQAGVSPAASGPAVVAWTPSPPPCSSILGVEECSPDLVPPAMEASARREIHVRQRDSTWRSFRSNLHLRTRSSAVSSPRKAPSGRLCISQRASVTWTGHTGHPIRRICISARAPIVCATTKVHLLPDRRRAVCGCPVAWAPVGDGYSSKFPATPKLTTSTPRSARALIRGQSRSARASSVAKRRVRRSSTELGPWPWP